MNNIYTEINTTGINTQNCITFIADPAHGAISTFIGIVRDFNLGKEVIAVEYDVHETMAKKVFYELGSDLIKHHNNMMKIYISHFKGKLDIEGISIVIGVSSPHRKEAIKCCNTLIDAIKHEAPIWKKEHYKDGETDWVKGHALCKH